MTNTNNDEQVEWVEFDFTTILQNAGFSQKEIDYITENNEIAKNNMDILRDPKTINDATVLKPGFLE